MGGKSSKNDRRARSTIGHNPSEDNFNFTTILYERQPTPVTYPPSTSSSYNANIQGSSSSNWPTVPIRTYSTLPSRDQFQEDADVARAMEISLSEYNSNLTPQSKFSSASTLRSSMVMSPNLTLYQNKGSDVNKNTVPTNSSISKVQTTIIECTICMEFNGKYEMVTTRCGHVFHRECVSPWINEAGTCPTCRVGVSLYSLVKIFVSVDSKPESNPIAKSAAVVTNSTSLASASNTKSTSAPTARAINPSNPSRRSKNKRNSNLRDDQLASTNFNRHLFLIDYLKELNVQSLENLISEEYNLGSEEFSIKRLRNRRKVSFKISVDSMKTFNILMKGSQWPEQVKVREFIERNNNRS